MSTPNIPNNSFNRTYNVKVNAIDKQKWEKDDIFDIDQKQTYSLVMLPK